MKKWFETTLKVKNTTRDRLKKLGTCGDTMDSVIVMLLDKAWNNGKKNETSTKRN